MHQLTDLQPQGKKCKWLYTKMFALELFVMDMYLFRFVFVYIYFLK